MIKIFAVLGAAVLSFCASAAFADPLLSSRQVITPPPYNAAAGTTDVAVYADATAYELARADKRFVLEKLTYRSGGLDVVAYLYRPADGSARPGVIFNRGGYVRNNAAPELLPVLHSMAARGFTVLAPMYRGSEGAQGRDEMGGADLADLMETAALVKELDAIKNDQLYLYGESRGGMMVYQALRDGFPARAAAVFGAFTDLGGLIDAAPDRYGPVAAQIWPDFTAQRAAIVARRSAIGFAEKIHTPLLIMHGGRDGDVPLRQSLNMATALADHGAAFDLVVFGDDSHILPNHKNERNALAARWFRMH